MPQMDATAVRQQSPGGRGRASADAVGTAQRLVSVVTKRRREARYGRDATGVEPLAQLSVHPGGRQKLLTTPP